MSEDVRERARARSPLAAACSGREGDRNARGVPGTTCNRERKSVHQGELRVALVKVGFATWHPRRSASRATLTFSMTGCAVESR